MTEDEHRLVAVFASIHDVVASEQALKEASEFGIDFPILVDETQLIGESLRLNRDYSVEIPVRVAAGSMVWWSIEPGL